MTPEAPILIEGYTPEELLSALDAETEALVFSGRAILFRAGTATVLGQFALNERTLVVELAQIEGGGEGVLPTLVTLAQRVARARNLDAIEWLVYATNCAKPNPKLRRVLERRGFVKRDVPGKGECYYSLAQLQGPDTVDTERG
jgi:hypothetical protein